ncbi:hypothetical protein [Merismopedia glauca]|uniref:hypothetical protein n=1 Tax=Merismopedia glauca TaxID=292586 RepID=UPI001FE249A4|nr:hypothetical protein [Merismopedia glauca]
MTGCPICLKSTENAGFTSATVIDVGTIRGRSWAAIEQNAAWGAGLYGCAPVRVLETIRYAVFRS